jgi:hypothetical protein
MLRAVVIIAVIEWHSDMLCIASIGTFVDQPVVQVLNEIRPYLVGTGGGGLENAGLDGPIVKVNY